MLSNIHFATSPIVLNSYSNETPKFTSDKLRYVDSISKFVANNQLRASNRARE